MSRCKYEMRERQVSYDDGLTWTSIEVIKGDLIEYQSADCPDSGSEITKWVDLEGDYICDDNKKYKKQVLYVSYDNGITWYIDLPTVYRQGEYVGVDDEYCSFKFEGHYIGTIPTPTPSPRPKPNRLDPLKIVACNNDPTLNGGETSYYTPMDLLWGRIGNCVTSIGDDAFNSYHNQSFSSITIPNSVTSIGYQAFYNCTSLTRINSNVDGVANLPSGLTSIGGNAFYSATSLTSIDIPSSVTSIGNSAFFRCGGLTSCTFEQGSQLTSIGTEAFGGCTSLPSINIPNSVTSIGILSFIGCTSLTSVTIGSGVTSISQQAFDGCTSLPSINIPNSVTSIGSYAFNNCTSLTSCTIPNTVTSIGRQAFRYCYSLTSVTVNATTPPRLNYGAFDSTNNCPIYVPCESVNAFKSDWSTYANRILPISSCTFNVKVSLHYVLDDDNITIAVPCDNSSTLSSAQTRAFYSISNLKEATIGDCITSIGDQAFSGCTSLTSIDIPSGVTSIGGSAFRGCRSLSSIDIPSGVTSIGGSAFYRCGGLTSCTIGSGVTSIGGSAFEDCSGLSSITVNATTPPTLGSFVFFDTNNCPIYVPAQSVDAYKSKYRWSDYADRIQAIP